MLRIVVEQLEKQLKKLKDDIFAKTKELGLKKKKAKAKKMTFVFERIIFNEGKIQDSIILQPINKTPAPGRLESLQ